jgi:hypothetical protein
MIRRFLGAGGYIAVILLGMVASSWRIAGEFGQAFHTVGDGWEVADNNFVAPHGKRHIESCGRLLEGPKIDKT